MWDLKCEDTLILCWFCPPKYVKHRPLKVLFGYLGEITEISVLSWQPNWLQNRKNIRFIWMFILLGRYNLYSCPVGGQTKSGSKAPFIVLHFKLQKFSFCPDSPISPKIEKNIRFFWMFILLGTYNLYHCPVGGQTKSGSKAPFIVLCIFCQRCLSPSQIIQAKKYRDP